MNRKFFLIFGSIPVIFVPVLGWTWLIFSVYSVILYFKKKVEHVYCSINLNSTVKYFISLLSFGMLTEIFAVVDNLQKPPGSRILLSPNPYVDLYLALGYYSGFALVWSLVMTRYKLTHLDVFLMAGIFGILFEQTGALIMNFQVFAWPYVFLVYGSFQAIPALLSENDFEHKRVELTPLKKIGVGILGEIGSFMAAGVFLRVLAIPIH